MEGKRRIRLTYSNVVASIALFAALGGSSYAAISVTGAQVRDSSLSGKDVRNASLTGRDVRDRSLRAKDFAQNQLPQGAQGPKGEVGPKGDAGAPGAKGDPGESGLAFLGGFLNPPIANNAGGSAGPVALDRASRLLVHGMLIEASFTCSAAAPGNCKLQAVPVVDGKAQPTPVPTLSIAPGQTKAFAPNTDVLAVTDVLPAGDHNVGIGLAGIGPWSGQSVSYGSREIFRVD